ncbi:GFA family protein [Duganella sp. Root198D2]|uniref:GFA family protein n=1 Tax=Duganella sp. Root198D2 TaxID=1736489 RepID=UPI00070CB1E9|nr:GFA family protein [Duganella sp. Root198D2]KRB95571.1 hypothetical protein ASE26_26435 [Duganella sp. Root198D2]
MTGTSTAECMCGVAAFELRGEPAAHAHCHCNACRDFYATAILSATAWKAEAVQVTRGETASVAHSARRMARMDGMARNSCWRDFTLKSMLFP